MRMRMARGMGCLVALALVAGTVAYGKDAGGGKGAGGDKGASRPSRGTLEKSADGKYTLKMKAKAGEESFALDITSADLLKKAEGLVGKQVSVTGKVDTGGKKITDITAIEEAQQGQGGGKGGGQGGGQGGGGEKKKH